MCNLFHSFLIAIVCLGFVASSSASEVAAVDMATVDSKDLSKWGDVQKDGTVSYRSSQKGASVQVPAWWPKEQMRPSEGEFYLVTLKYKDTLSKPAWFASLSGVGGWLTDTKILGFGGDNDGQWKEIQIPLPWDYVIRIHTPQNKANHKPEYTYFKFHTSESLALASITVDKVERTPELKAQFFANLRKATSYAQKDIQKKATQAANTLAGITDNIVAFPTSPDVSLLPGIAPQVEHIGKAIKVRMTRDEFQPATFGVFANKKLTNVTYKVNGLSTLKANFTPRTASYAVMVRRGKNVWTINAWYPEYAVDVEQGYSQAFLLDIKTNKETTKAGVYKGTIDISSDQGSASLPIEVEVDNTVLLSMGEAGLTYGDSISGLTPISDMRERIDYNQNSALLWYSGCLPRMWYENGKMQLDFAYIDDWMVAAKKAGVDNVVWFLGGDPFWYPYNLNLAVDIANRKPGYGKMRLINAQGKNPNRIEPSIRGEIATWLKKVDAHAKKANWPTIHYTPFDEPSKWTRTTKKSKGKGTIGSGAHIKPVWIDYVNLIKETLPDAKIYASIHEEIHRGKNNVGTIFEPYINSFCTNAVGRYPVQGERMLKAVEKRKNTENPVEFWQYGFVGNNDPGAIRFSYGFFFGGWGSTGTMGWAYDAGADDHNILSYNARKAWATPFGNLPRACFVGLREGADDRRLIATCEKRLADNKDAMAIVAKIRKAGREGASESKGGKDLTYDFWETTDDMQRLENWRKELLDLLK